MAQRRSRGSWVGCHGSGGVWSWAFVPWTLLSTSDRPLSFTGDGRRPRRVGGGSDGEGSRAGPAHLLKFQGRALGAPRGRPALSTPSEDPGKGGDDDGTWSPGRPEWALLLEATSPASGLLPSHRRPSTSRPEPGTPEVRTPSACVPPLSTDPRRSARLSVPRPNPTPGFHPTGVTTPTVRHGSGVGTRVDRTWSGEGSFRTGRGSVDSGVCTRRTSGVERRPVVPP